MWHRLSLALLLVASMARSSSSSGSTACPKNCQCIISASTQFNDEMKNNSASIEAQCDDVPRLDYLPENIRTLIVRGSKPWAITRLMFDLENIAAISLRELVLINCSLTSFNVTLGQITKNHDIPIFLNLSSNEIREIEELNISNGESLAELDMSNNRLTRLTSEAFVDYRQLLKLFLRGNSIGVVEKNAFAGLDRLESLDLSDNQLGNLVEDTFSPLCYLKILNLGGNRLGVLGEKLFNNRAINRDLEMSHEDRQQFDLETSSRSEDNELSLILGSVQRLETIDASRIGLERVPSALTRSVRSVNLSGNRLTIIRGGDFDSYPLLRILDLSYNTINVVENDALGRLEILEKLDITGNRLSELPQSLPSGLRVLIVRENSIVKLRRGDLEGLDKLETLIIDQNDITEIEEGSMSQLSFLKELDLSENPIKQLPADTFGGPVNLVALRLSMLKSLKWGNEEHADTAFPVPSPERLVSLDLSGSPALAAQLLADEAALSACKSIRRLDISRTNLTELRSDLPYLLPQLRTLGLSGNRWNCTNRENHTNWLAGWIKEHEEIFPPTECSYHNNTRVLFIQLPISDSPSTTTTKTTTNVVANADKASRNVDDSGDSSERRIITTALDAHPGIFIFLCTTIVALAVILSLVIAGISRSRQSMTIRRNLEHYEQWRPIVTELW